jgi:perosamine synthetase
MNLSARTEFEHAFARIMGGGSAFAFWKGRVALYSILKGLGIGAGDEVIVPGYTCVMNVNPIIYLGAKPVYVDIEPRTFDLDCNLLESKITSRTRVIIAQHTYGYPCDMDVILGIAGRHGIKVVEDCCLTLGSKYKGRLAGTFGPAAYFSFQWNKPFTTGLGGMALVHDRDLQAKVASIYESAAEASTKETLMLAAQLSIYRALIYPRTTALAQSLFRLLAKKGAVVGSSSAAEFEPVMPDGFLKKMSTMQSRAGLRQLKKTEANWAHRRRLASLYDELLRARGLPVRQYDKNIIDPVMVRYPVRVREKNKAMADAAGAGIELGSWFECPLHPQETPMEKYGYERGMCPEAERACGEVINLPLHPRASERTVRRSVGFISSYF